MTQHPEMQQLDLIDYLRKTKEPRYTATTLAKKYGLSRGQALTLIKIHGRSCRILGAVIASKPYP